MENSNFHDTEIIEVSKEFHPTCDYDSHRPFLWLALNLFPKENLTPFSELGCGHGSTLVVNEFCKKQGRLFFSYETNKEWSQKFNNIVTSISNYNDLHVSNHGIIFVDSAPGEQRKELISKFANDSDFIIVHDTEEGAEYVYGMSEILNSFKYRIDLHITGAPSTTMVSNFIDLNYLKGKRIFDYIIE
jgi:hypothetical protein